MGSRGLILMVRSDWRAGGLIRRCCQIADVTESSHERQVQVRHPPPRQVARNGRLSGGLRISRCKERETLS